MFVLCLILGALLALSVYVNYRISVNYWSLMDNYEDAVGDSENTTNFVLRLREIVLEMNERLKEIDSKGSFESDDEVGYFFIQLKEIIDDINKEFFLDAEIQEEETME